MQIKKSDADGSNGSDWALELLLGSVPRVTHADIAIAVAAVESARLRLVLDMRLDVLRDADVDRRLRADVGPYRAVLRGYNILGCGFST